jgi:hypothetical protein
VRAQAPTQAPGQTIEGVQGALDFLMAQRRTAALSERIFSFELITRVEQGHGDFLNRVAVGSRGIFGLVLVGPACRWRMTVVRTPALRRRLVNFCATGRFVNRAL